MRDTNLVIESGNVATAPKFASFKRTDRNGKQVTAYSVRFSVAINHNYRDRSGKLQNKPVFVHLHRYLYTSGQYDYFKNNITVPKHIAYIGRLEPNVFKSKKYGTVKRNEIVPKSIAFLGAKKSSK